jgi:hypothetical protein
MKVFSKFLKFWPILILTMETAAQNIVAVLEITPSGESTLSIQDYAP